MTPVTNIGNGDWPSSLTMNRRHLLGGITASAALASSGIFALRRPASGLPQHERTVIPVETGLLAGKIPFIHGGAGPRHAVVFFGGNARCKRLDKSSDPRRYARQIARILPEGFRFTVLGYEETPPDHYTLDTIVRDLAHVIRSEAGKPDLVIGISFGGFVALRFAASHPELVGCLVLLVSGHRFSEQGW